jgi:uncharacterized protein (DUF169 family)
MAAPVAEPARMLYRGQAPAMGDGGRWPTQTGNPQTGDRTMSSQTVFNTYGADLEAMLRLKTYPIAIKMLADESEVPEGAIRPKRDRGEHYAVCQAFSLARRQGLTVAMFLEDHWCFEPIISYGLVEPPEDYLEGRTNSFFMADKKAAAEHARQMTRLPVGQYPGMVIGPLETADFEPDLVMIYCDTAQLRHLLLALRYLHGTQVISTLDPIGSCVHSVVPSLLHGDCKVTVPDPGDFERAGAQEDEMVLTVPASRLEELMQGVYHLEEIGMGYRRFVLSMHPDFKQPPFYEEYFAKWGLEGPRS